MENEVTVTSLKELGFTRREFLSNTYELIKGEFVVEVVFDVHKIDGAYKQVFDKCSILPKVITLKDMEQLLRKLQVLELKE